MITNIYFDTEFTGLLDRANLISIGLVGTGDIQFYAELTDIYDAIDCNEFCKQYVLPLLEVGEAQMPFSDLQQALTAFIKENQPSNHLLVRIHFSREDRLLQRNNISLLENTRASRCPS